MSSSSSQPFHSSILLSAPFLPFHVYLSFVSTTTTTTTGRSAACDSARRSGKGLSFFESPFVSSSFDTTLIVVVARGRAGEAGGQRCAQGGREEQRRTRQGRTTVLSVTQMRVSKSVPRMPTHRFVDKSGETRVERCAEGGRKEQSRRRVEGRIDIDALRARDGLFR